MIRANDKGLNTPPPVAVEDAPRRRLPALTPRNLLVIVGALAWIILLLVVVTQVLGKKSAPPAKATGSAAAQAQAVAPAQTRAVAQPAIGAESSAAPGGAAVGPKAVPAPELDLQNRVINLSNGTGYKYVKMSLVVLFADPGSKFAKASAANLTKMEATFAADHAGATNAFNDVLTTVVSSKSAADLATPQGKEALRSELIAKFNQALGGTDTVTWIDFTDFVMQ